MNCYRLLASQYFDGTQFHNNKVLTITHGIITAIDDDIQNYDQAVSGLLTAGFIDLQVNGGGDVLFNGTPSLSGLAAIIDAHLAFGTTSMLPTVITDNANVMVQAADTIAQAIREQLPGVLGIHFEGPHLSVAKKGAHSAPLIRPMSDVEWQLFVRADLGQVVVTLAPEQVACADITKLTGQGVKVCLGHSNADFDTTQRAIAAGADGFTHLFNAMSPLQARAPGMVGCALLNDHTYAGIIIDGQHVDYQTAKIAMRMKPNGRLFLVTDAMPPVGGQASEFNFFDRTVQLDDGKLTSTTGELAGSILDMASAVRNTVHGMGVALAEALRMASLYPAQYLAQDYRLGKLAVNYQADMVLLNEQLEVQATWVAGIQRVNKQVNNEEKI